MYIAVSIAMTPRRSCNDPPAEAMNVSFVPTAAARWAPAECPMITILDPSPPYFAAFSLIQTAAVATSCAISARLAWGRNR